MSVTTLAEHTKSPLYQPGMSISELKRRYSINEVIKLASNENPLGSSPLALEAAKKALTNPALYPDSSGYDLKIALSQSLSIDPSQIILTNGSEEAISLVVRAFVGIDEEVIVSQYAFIAFTIFANSIPAKIKAIPAKNWEHDLNAIASAVSTETKLIFIANPNNPTGTWFSHEALIEFLIKIPKHIIIILDEAYYEYVKRADGVNAINLLSEYPNLIVTRTFSKAYGLAGLRLGYSVSHSQIAATLNHLRTPFNINSVALAAAEASLVDQEFLHQVMLINQSGMKQLEHAFTDLGLTYIPSAANFISVNLGSKAHEIYEFLLSKGIIVRPLKNYGMDNYLRITVGTESQNSQLINCLKLIKG